MDGSGTFVNTSALPLNQDSLTKAIKVEKEDFLESDISSAESSFIPFLTADRVKTEVCDDGGEDSKDNLSLVITSVTLLKAETGEILHSPKAGPSTFLQFVQSDAVKCEKAKVVSSTHRVSPVCTEGRSMWTRSIRQNEERQNRRCNMARKVIGLHHAKPCSVKLTRSVFKKRKALGKTAHHCERCGRGFLQNGAFKRHQRMHIGGNSRGCDINRRTFRIYGTLSYYWKRDMGGTWYLYKGCGKACSRGNQLGRHQDAQNSEKSSWNCKQIKGSLVTQLKNDQRIHRRENYHRCKGCGAEFSRAAKLKSHHCTHRLYSCTVCNKTFLQAVNLKNHQRIHTKEKPFICKECGKAFSQVTQLNNHWRIHTGERPYKCELCDKAFSQVTNVNNHYRTHTGERPYQCQICGKAFTQVTSLNNHYRIHTGEKPFRCNMCDKSFSQVANLNSHQRLHHSKQQPFES